MNGAAMLALQEIDTALDAIGHRRPRLPEVATHAAAAAALADLRRQQAAVQARVDAARAAIEAAEQAAHELTAKRDRLDAQLKTVIAPREAEALMNQIATINTQRSELDEQELTAMDDQTVAEEALVALAEAEPAVATALAEAEAALAAAGAGLDAEAAALEARKVEALAALTEADVRAYEHARHQHGGVGVARLDGHRCSGCHLDLSPAEMDVVKATPAGEPAECPQCARFLVR